LITRITETIISLGGFDKYARFNNKRRSNEANGGAGNSKKIKTEEETTTITTESATNDVESEPLDPNWGPNLLQSVDITTLPIDIVVEIVVQTLQTIKNETWDASLKHANDSGSFSPVPPTPPRESTPPLPTTDDQSKSVSPDKIQSPIATEPSIPQDPFPLPLRRKNIISAFSRIIEMESSFSLKALHTPAGIPIEPGTVIVPAGVKSLANARNGWLMLIARCVRRISEIVKFQQINLEEDNNDPMTVENKESMKIKQEKEDTFEVFLNDDTKMEESEKKNEEKSIDQDKENESEKEKPIDDEIKGMLLDYILSDFKHR